MAIPAPSPLGSQSTVARGCLGGVFPGELLREVSEAGFMPVLQHHLLGKLGTSEDGPREILAATMHSLENAGHGAPWGAGCSVGTTEEAALFATAGYTWFTFELAGFLDARAGSMSLDELDAAIVALEDAGCYSHAWHDSYLGREWQTTPGTVLRFDDETLARTAVKFGPALAHAEQLQQVIRTLWVGHGCGPNIELCFAARRVAMSAGEFLFVASESARRGIDAVSIAPSFGPAWQPGGEFALGTCEFEKMTAPFREVAALRESLKVGIHFCGEKPGLLSAIGKLGAHVHVNCEDATSLHCLRHLADTQPKLFREWLTCAQELFPFAIGDAPLSITEEDIQALPEVPDAELRATFFGHTQGRQLLLVTFLAVVRQRGMPRRVPMHT